MTETEQPGIDGFNFHVIGIFFFDFPGQSTEIRSTLPRRSVGINCYFDHNNLPPFQNQKQTSLSLVVTISYRSF